MRSDSGLRRGVELCGRYRLEERIGAGGMGEVWRGVDLRLRRPVAIKILPVELAADRTAAERFRGEAETSAALQHPGITVIFDVDEHPSEQGRLLFLVMELLTGGRVLAVSAHHPLAERGHRIPGDLADNHVVDLGPDAPEYWVVSMVPTRTPSGRRIPRGPTARTFHEILSLVGTGQCVHPLGEIAARYNSPPGIVFLPIRDAPALQWALTWRSTVDSPVIRALAQTAAELGPISL